MVFIRAFGVVVIGMAFVCGCTQTNHPRLFLSAGDLPALRERAATTHARYTGAARTIHDWEAQARPKLPQSPTSWDNWPIEPWTARMVNGAVLAAATRDPAVARQAVEWLLGLCQCRAAADNNYTYGFYAIALATGYDLLHDDLTGPQRETVRRQLADVCQGLYDSSTGKARGWWRGLPLHHDCLIPTAGLGVAALALKGEDERWRQWYEFSRDQVTLTLSLLGEDGAWPEGPSGWTYLMSAILPFCEAARNVAGDDFYATSPWLKATGRARLNLLLPSGGYFFYGDGYRDGGYGGMGTTAGHQLRLLAGRLRDGRVQWLAEREERSIYESFEKARSESQPDGPPPGGSPPAALFSAAWSLLWYDETLKPTPPDDLPLAHAFGNLGYVMARTGWDAKAEMLTFRAGPVTGQAAAAEAARRGPDFAARVAEGAEHAHMEQNAITFFADGVYWLSPPGYGARSSARHATLLVNGRQQTRDVKTCLTGGRLLRQEFAADHVYLLGDASGVYPAEAGFDRFLRHVLWLKPDVLVVCDDVRGSKPLAIEWRMHPGEKVAAEVAGDAIRLTAPDGKSSRMVRFLAPEGVRMIAPTTKATDEEPKDYRKTLHQLMKMSYCGAANREPADRVTFLAVLAPPGVEAARADAGDQTGVTVTLVDGRKLTVAFSADGGVTIK